MTGLTTSANLVELSTLDEDSRITATLDRSELEALLDPQASHRLWFELGVEGEAEPQRLTLELSEEDIRALLAGTGDELELALDGGEIAELLEEPDVEAHGLRGALAVSLAVATTAIAAPSALAATPQALTASVSPAVSSQQVGAAATTQVSSQIVRQQLVRGAAAKSQRASAYKFAQLTILRAGAVR
jgi:hypothetical protein